MHRNNKVSVDYRQLKSCVSIMMILDHYGWVRELKGTGNVLRGPCPIHNGSNSKQFTVNIRNQTWFCFGDCRRGGSILEFVASMERIEIQEAAVRIASWFSISTPHFKSRSSLMSENQKPSYKAFTVEDRGEGEDADAFWTRIGSAWPHKDGKGFNIALSALPVNGRIVLREFTDEDAKAEEEKKPQKRANSKR